MTLKFVRDLVLREWENGLRSYDAKICMIMQMKKTYKYHYAGFLLQVDDNYLIVMTEF